MTRVSTASVMPQRAEARDRGLVRLWLYGVALLIVVMVLVGGATRLTDSGLSITEWRPIHGIVPPLDEAEWQEEFAKYREIPEYRLVNPDMTLASFKVIFWWEWAHRALGRLIGAVFLLPLVALAFTGRIERRLVPPLAGLFVLGGLQGAVGWWMVASGLVARTDVSQYRLAVHLTFALVILAFIVWVARGLLPGGAPAPRRLVGAAVAVLGLVFVQIFLGGLVAGLDAGLVSDSWPLMNGALVPGGLLFREPAWRNLFENPLTVHFDHRLAAYLLLLAAVAHVLQAARTPFFRGAATLAALVLLQAGLGIATVVEGVPLPLALAHQLGAVAVLVAAVVHLRSMVPPAAEALTGTSAAAGARWSPPGRTSG